MATVTSITAARADEIYKASITSAELVGNNMVLRTRGGAEFTLPNVKANAIDAWPIGSIFIHSASTPPATLLGGGTWERFGQGRVLVSQDGSQAEFDTALETGGQKTYAMAVAELPSHAHTAGSGYVSNDHSHSGVTNTDGTHTHVINNSAGAADGTNRLVHGTSGSGGSTQNTYAEPTGSAHAHGFTTGGISANHTHDITVNATPAAVPVVGNNLQPFIVVYMWKRTA